MAFLGHWMNRAQLPARWFLNRLGLPRSTFHHWQARELRPRHPAPRPPPAHSATPEETAAVLSFARLHPLEGYRSLAFMMLDANVAALSPSSVYRVLKASGPLKDAADKAALLLIEAADRAALDAIIARDPFAAHGLIADLVVEEWDPLFGVFNDPSSMPGQMQG